MRVPRSAATFALGQNRACELHERESGDEGGRDADGEVKVDEHNPSDLGE